MSNGPVSNSNSTATRNSSARQSLIRQIQDHQAKELRGDGQDQLKTQAQRMLEKLDQSAASDAFGGAPAEAVRRAAESIGRGAEGAARAPSAAQNIGEAAQDAGKSARRGIQDLLGQPGLGAQPSGPGDVFACTAPLNPGQSGPGDVYACTAPLDAGQGNGGPGDVYACTAPLERGGEDLLKDFVGGEGDFGKRTLDI